MISLSHLRGQSIGVLGLGASGLATARALKAAGADVVCWDDTDAARAKASAEGFVVAQPDMDAITMLVTSPGIPIAYPTPHPIIAEALASQIDVIGDIELFAQARAALPKHSVIGITGTNGKSTTTALIGHCLNAAAHSAHIGGNFGPPVLSLPADGGVYVLELSSFQLEQTQSLACDVAIFLNLSPDHGDRYASMADYGAAKQRLFDMQTSEQVAVLALDDEEGRRLAGQVSGKVTGVSVSGNPDALWQLKHGALLCGGNPVSKAADWPALKGPHNAQNAAAAAAACAALGLSFADIAHGLETFPGLAHRSQHVGSLGAIAFVNDSKATNPDAAARSLMAYENIHWLAGGSDKGGDFSVLNDALSNVTRAYFFGQTGPVLKEAVLLEEAACFETMESAFDAAVANAKASSEPATVLLSPACASFDQFRNFAHRGEVFSQLARGVQQEAA
ncbi:MAG: UDP-N-acetylmuramoyl-L-alanine--D-glutamate ligase [Pseudomonadota bacterium]